MKSDFDRWLDYHCTAYPGMLKWLSDEANKGQVAHMRRLLDRYTVEQLSAATDALYEMHNQPAGYSNHARAVRDLVREQTAGGGDSKVMAGPRVVGGELTAACWRCMDYGIVSVLNPATLKRLRDPEQAPTVLGTCCVACDCDAGHHHQRLPTWSHNHCLIRFDDVSDEACESHQAMWEVARQMVAQRDAELTPAAQELSGDVLP